MNHPALLQQAYGRYGEHPTHPVLAWQAIVARGHTRLSYWKWVAECLNDEERKHPTTPTKREYRLAAQATKVEWGVIEVDDNAEVSLGDGDGAYVQAWVWIYNTDVPGYELSDEGET